MVVTKMSAEALARPANEEAKAEEVRRNPCVVLILKVLKIILDQWLIIGFALACVFGYLWPSRSYSRIQSPLSSELVLYIRISWKLTPRVHTKMLLQPAE